MVVGIGLNNFDVEDGGKRGLVDFSNGTCSFQVWHVPGLPCGHVIAVSRFLGETDCGHYAMSCYSNEVYKSTYAAQINPPPHKLEWEISDGMVDLQPLHISKRQASRPKENKRILSRGEEPTPIYCSRCKTYGHRRESCSQPTKTQSSSRRVSKIQPAPVQVELEEFQDYIFQNTFPSYNLGDF
ncbi:putative transcription factor interactor and regulator CCHC(Zn) family [Helianthus annuus]|nr:putative transcription factor interactor and regulator CCHC(Zn) family [Helianthus annuus]